MFLYVFTYGFFIWLSEIYDYFYWIYQYFFYYVFYVFYWFFISELILDMELISKNMKISKMNRHVILIGRPGSGKSRYYFKPNILNANGTIIVTDPKRRTFARLWLFIKEKRLYNKSS